MIKIAIVDDEYATCELIQEKTINSFIDTKIDFRTYLFNSANQLLDTIEENVYDIILLDIDMPEINGLETTKIIRDKKLNSIIIYITSKITYMPSAFGLNVFAFINKNDIETVLIKTIKECIDYLSSNTLLTFKTKEGFITLQKSEIIAASYKNRKVSLWTKDGEYSINHTILKEFYDMVKEDDFIYINRGTIINLLYLKSTRGGVVTLQNLDDFEEFSLISKEKLKEVNLFMMKYVSKKGILK